MKRWLVIFLAIILGAGATSREVAAQQVSKMPRVGVLHQTAPERTKAGDEFREGMRSLSWIEGSTISIENRFANGDLARLSANAADLAAAKVDVIVAFGRVATQAARQATSTIPIVTSVGDPDYGLVASLARPGANVSR